MTRVAILGPNGFYEQTGIFRDQAIRLLKQPLLELAFMMACDTGWTGMIFEAGGETWKLWTDDTHVVDVRKARSYELDTSWVK